MLTASLLTSYGLSALGGLMIVHAVADMLRRRINVASANQMLIKLARAGNLERAAKLCMAVSGTYLDAVGAAIEQSKGAVDRSATEIAVHSAFDDVAKSALARWQRMNERGLLGVIAVGGALALAISSGELSLPLEVAAAAAGLSGLWLLARRTYYATAVAEVRATVLPAIVDARLGMHDGDEIAVGATRLELVHPGLPLPSVPAPAVVSTVAPPPATSLESGTCPLCKHAVIKTVQRDDPRFRTLVCASCGYAQEFANLDALP